MTELHSSNPTTPSKQLGRQTLTGLIFVGASALAVKGMSFIAHVALGWLLTNQDFKLWGMATSLTTFTAGIQGGGASRYLLQTGHHSPTSIRPIARYCLGFNLLAALILVAAGPIAQRAFQTDGIFPIVVCMAIFALLNSPVSINRSRLSVESKFRTLATVDARAKLVHYGLMIVLATIGFGALSFVIPSIVSALVAWWLSARALGPMAPGDALTWNRFRDFFAAGRWIMLAGFAASLGSTGDYLIIAAFAPDILGDYFFGYQLTLVIAMVIAPGMLQVLTPTFAKLNNEPTRQANAYQSVARALPFAGMSICVALAVLSPPLIHFIWQGKWDASIPVAQVMSINVGLRLLSPIYASLLQAKGRWATLAAYQLVEGVIVILSSYVGTQIGGLAAVALTIGLSRSVTPLLFTVMGGQIVGVSRGTLARSLALRTGLPLAVAGAIWAAMHFVGYGDLGWKELVVNAVLLTLGLGGLAALVFRADIRQVVSMFRQHSKHKVPALPGDR